jgi:hypothetical protein
MPSVSGLIERDGSETRMTGGQNKSASTVCVEPASLANHVKNLQYDMERTFRTGANVSFERRLRLKEKGETHPWIMIDIWENF